MFHIEYFLIKKIKAFHFSDIPDTKTPFSNYFYKYSHVIYFPTQQNGTKYLNSTFEIDFKLLFRHLFDPLRTVLKETLSLSISREINLEPKSQNVCF